MACLRGKEKYFFVPTVPSKRPLPCGPLPVGVDWHNHGLDRDFRELVTQAVFLLVL